MSKLTIVCQYITQLLLKLCKCRKAIKYPKLPSGETIRKDSGRLSAQMQITCGGHCVTMDVY